MLILSPQDVRKEKKREEDFSRKTLSDLNECLLTARRDLVEFEAHAKRTKASQEAEIEARNLEIFELNKEIEQKKSERREQLVPIEHLKEKVEEELQLARQKKGDATVAERNAKKAEQVFIEKLESLADREQAVEDEEESLKRRKKGIERAEEEVSRLSGALSVRMKEHAEAVEEHNENVIEHRREMAQREHAVQVLREAVDRDKKDLEDRERALKDKYITFQRSITRINT